MREETLGEIIHDARKRKGLTQMELAHLCGISTSMVSHVEHNDCSMSLDLYSLMTQVLDIDLGTVFTIAKQRKSAEYAPYIEKADEATLTVIRRILGMPECQQK